MKAERLPTNPKGFLRSLSISRLIAMLSHAHVLGFSDEQIELIEDEIKSRLSGLSTDHTFMVTISGCTREQAEQVMRERIGSDEDYGFEYTVGWTRVHLSSDSRGGCSDDE